MTRIFSGFPGVGKSTLFKHFPDQVADSDSSTFDKSDFPANYIRHIQSVIEDGSKEVLFVSSHKVVRDALTEAEIDFTLVYPSLECKEEYLRRYINRESPEAFIKLLTTQFDNWVNECMEFEGDKIELPSGKYIADLIDLKVIPIIPDSRIYPGNYFSFPEPIKPMVKSVQFHHWENSTAISVLVTLYNGHQVTGFSRPMDDSVFDLNIGLVSALQKTYDPIFEIKAFLKRDKDVLETVKDKGIPLPDYGDLVTREEWEEYEHHLDGTSYPSDGKVYWRESPKLKESTHVIYFGK